VTEIANIGELPPVDARLEVSKERGNVSWNVPEEVPVAFVYNRRNYAVMLATPDDLEDFAAGFSLTERVVDAADEIESIEVRADARGIELHIGIARTRLERLDIRQRRRNLVGRAGCGVCGLENAESFFETLKPVGETLLTIENGVLERAYTELENHQPLNARTRTVHAAAWVNLEGQILLAREDVGRHNALDKLLGALSLRDTDMRRGFALMSSRCSYEIVEKAARLGVRAVASISGPTGFAIRKATEANMALYAFAGDGFARVDRTGHR
jgi:formate dehydrogenase accessory protein FdhD